MKWLKISILCRFVTLICEKTGLITRNSTLSDYSSIVRNVGKVLIKFFADYIGCELSTCSKWLKGERKLKPEQIKKTHEFLQGTFLKTVDEIVKE